MNQFNRISYWQACFHNDHSDLNLEEKSTKVLCKTILYIIYNFFNPRHEQKATEVILKDVRKTCLSLVILN